MRVILNSKRGVSARFGLFINLAPPVAANLHNILLALIPSEINSMSVYDKLETLRREVRFAAG